MRKLLFFRLMSILLVLSGCVKKESGNFILVKGGTFINIKSNLYKKNVTVSDFYIGKYEVTQKEWTEVMDSNPSKFKGDNLPVETISWYECVEYCNRRSIKEGLKPYYNINKNKKDTINRSGIDSIKWIIMINPGANGYRLASETEWEYAASGGQKSKNYSYSGSDDVNQVAWYWRNSGDSTLSGSWLWPTIEKNNCKTNPVGLKKPNELGIYDMSGNVREWCEEWYQDYDTDIGYFKSLRGGGWIGAGYCCKISFRGKLEANGKGPDQGFRLCRSK